jgi:hypothetical protein
LAVSEHALLSEDLVDDFAELYDLVALIFEGLLDYEVGDAPLEVQLCHIGAHGDLWVAIVWL